MSVAITSVRMCSPPSYYYYFCVYFHLLEPLHLVGCTEKEQQTEPGRVAPLRSVQGCHLAPPRSSF